MSVEIPVDDPNDVYHLDYEEKDGDKRRLVRAPIPLKVKSEELVREDWGDGGLMGEAIRNAPIR